MAKLVLHAVRDKAYQLICWPVIVAVILVLLMVCFGMTYTAVSAFLGIVVWFLPNFYFAYRVFSRIETRAKQFVMTFYLAEASKLLISAIIFIIICKLFPIAMLPFLLGYSVAQVTFWVTALYTLRA